MKDARKHQTILVKIILCVLLLPVLNIKAFAPPDLFNPNFGNPEDVLYWLELIAGPNNCVADQLHKLGGVRKDGFQRIAGMGKLRDNADQALMNLLNAYSPKFPDRRAMIDGILAELGPEHAAILKKELASHAQRAAGIGGRPSSNLDDLAKALTPKPPALAAPKVVCGPTLPAKSKGWGWPWSKGPSKVSAPFVGDVLGNRAMRDLTPAQTQALEGMTKYIDPDVIEGVELISGAAGYAMEQASGLWKRTTGIASPWDIGFGYLDWVGETANDILDGNNCSLGNGS